MKILYFSWIKDKIGKDQEDININKDINTISKLINYLSSKDNAYKEAFIDGNSVKFSINMKMANLSDKISNDDEIAFFPPMTGG